MVTSEATPTHEEDVKALVAYLAGQTSNTYLDVRVISAGLGWPVGRLKRTLRTIGSRGLAEVAGRLGYRRMPASARLLVGEFGSCPMFFT